MSSELEQTKFEDKNEFFRWNDKKLFSEFQIDGSALLASIVTVWSKDEENCPHLVVATHFHDLVRFRLIPNSPRISFKVWTRKFKKIFNSISLLFERRWKRWKMKKENSFIFIVSLKDFQHEVKLSTLRFRLVYRRNFFDERTKFLFHFTFQSNRFLLASIKLVLFHCLVVRKNRKQSTVIRCSKFHRYGTVRSILIRK